MFVTFNEHVLVCLPYAKLCFYTVTNINTIINEKDCPCLQEMHNEKDKTDMNSTNQDKTPLKARTSHPLYVRPVLATLPACLVSITLTTLAHIARQSSSGPPDWTRATPVPRPVHHFLCNSRQATELLVPVSPSVKWK